MTRIKSFWTKTLLIGFMVGAIQGSGHASTPIEKRVPITHVYAPKGFDNNDRTEIVVTGYLPNLCHRSPTASVKVEGETIKIEITSLYYEPTNPFCPPMKVPFDQKVTTGVLEKGHYQIVVNGGLIESEKSLITIQEASSSAIDENVYALVDEIDKDEDNGKVTLKGYNPSDCYVLDKIRYFSNDRDTYSILPIMKQVNSFCPMKLVPFKVDFTVPKELNSEKILLHVRSMDGNAVNSIFTQKFDE